jgi:hypothetical protein
MPKGIPKKKEPEQQIAVHLIVPDSKLGMLIRMFTDVRGSEIKSVLPITPHDNARNLPQGSFKDAVVEIINKTGGKINFKTLKVALETMGFKKSRCHSGVADAIKSGNIKRVNGVVTLAKWKGE